MPAAAMTYTTLVSDIKSYAERYSDTLLDSQIPRLIMLAEARISQEVKILPALSFVTDTFQAGVSIYPKPARLRDVDFVNFGAGTAGFETTPPFNRRINLLRKAYDTCREFWPDPTATGVPQFYSDYGMAHWLIVPTPNANYPFEVGFYERAAPLSADNQTNWLTEYAPNLLLYACLLETAPYLKNFDILKEWKDMYNRAALALSNEDVLQSTDAQSSATQEGTP